MAFVAKKIYLTKGVGKHRERLSSFELALRNAGIAFTVHATNIPELPQPGESGRDCAERLARQKAFAAFHHRADAFVLGADTVVVVEGEILGKPRDHADAATELTCHLISAHRIRVPSLRAPILRGPMLRWL